MLYLQYREKFYSDSALRLCCGGTCFQSQSEYKLL